MAVESGPCPLACIEWLAKSKRSILTSRWSLGAEWLDDDPLRRTPWLSVMELAGDSDMNMYGWNRRAAIALLSSLTFMRHAAGQTWPAAGLRVMVPFGPGGSTDIMGRLLATGLQKRLGVPVLVENRGGAATSIGTAEAARAPADGQTWLVTSDSFAVLPALVPNLTFNIIQDFVPVTLIATAPNVIALHPSRPWRNVTDLLSAARQGQLSYASTGNGTTGHLAMTRFAAANGISLAHAAYRSGGLALNDAVAGHVDMIIGSAALLAPMLAAERLRPVVQLGATRLPALAQVPTSAESGFPDFLAETWWGILAPARTPTSALDRMFEEAKAVFREDTTAKQVTETQQASLRLDGPEAMRSFLAGQITGWGEVIRTHAIKAD